MGGSLCQRASQSTRTGPPPEQMLIGRFYMKKGAVVSTVAMSIQVNQLKVSYLGLAIRAAVLVGCGALEQPVSMLSCARSVALSREQ